MKRKKLIKALFIFVNILIFVDFSRVNAAGPQVKTTEVKKFIILEGYKECYKAIASEKDFLKTKTTDKGLMIYVNKTPKVFGFNTNGVEKMECVKNDNTKENIVFSIPIDAKVYHPENDSANSNNQSSDSSTSNGGTSSNNNSSSNNSDDLDCTGLLGNPEEDGTVANFLKKTLRFVQFCGPILVIVMTILESVKAVASGDKDELTKMLKKTSKRIIYAVLLFIFPLILNIILKWTNVYGTCGL